MKAIVILASVIGASISCTETRAQDFSRGQLFNLEIMREAALEQGPDFSLPLPFSFPGDARTDSIFGVDVSHHNFDQCHCKVDWSKAPARNVVFVYLKATQGTGFSDPTFADNWKSLGPTAVHRGAYHFLASDTDPVEQAKFFVNAVRKAGGTKPSDMPPSLDVEWDIRTSGGKIIKSPDGRPLDYWNSVAPQEIVAKMEAWLTYVEKELGRTPIIYTSRAWWLGRIKDENLIKRFGKYKTWIADYSASGRGSENPPDFPEHPKFLWQFTEAGNVKDLRLKGGGDLGVDASIFKGDKSTFAKELGM